MNLNSGLISAHDRSAIVMALRLAATIASVLGHAAQADYYRALARKVSVATYLKVSNNTGNEHDDAW